MRTLPVLPVKGSVILPGSGMPLRIERTQSIKAIEKAQKSGQLVLAITQKKVNEDSKDDSRVYPLSDLHTVGTLAKIEKIRGDATSGYHVVLRGISRHRVIEFTEAEGAIFAEAEEWKDEEDSDKATYQALLKSIKLLSKEILELIPTDTRHIAEIVEGVDDLSFLGYLVMSNLEMETDKKQEILGTYGLKDRSLILLGHLQKLKGALEIQGEIRDKLSHKLGKMQRESILREQLKTIREELGDSEKDGEGEADYRKKSKTRECRKKFGKTRSTN